MPSIILHLLGYSIPTKKQTLKTPTNEMIKNCIMEDRLNNWATDLKCLIKSHLKCS